jgi:hypothetical protein
MPDEPEIIEGRIIIRDEHGNIVATAAAENEDTEIDADG